MPQLVPSSFGPKKKEEERIKIASRPVQGIGPAKIQLNTTGSYKPRYTTREEQRQFFGAPKQSLGNRIRDVFDANTEADKYRRRSRGEAEDYRTQQLQTRRDNVQSIATNPFKRVFEEVTEPARRIGFGLAQGTGTADRARQARLRLQEIQNNSILTAQRKLKDPTVSLDEKTRWQNYLQKVQPDYARQQAESRAQLQRDIKDADPVAGVAAVAEMGLDIATLGAGGVVLKGGRTAARQGAKQFAKYAGRNIAKPVIPSAVGGGLGAVTSQGRDVTAQQIGLGTAAGAGLGLLFPAVGGAVGGATKKLRGAADVDAPTIKLKPEIDEAPTKVRIDGEELDTASISKKAINSLENDTTGIKPNGVARADGFVENGTARPIQVRRLENGDITIVDGRHTLEYVRQNNIQDFPVVDVTAEFNRARPEFTGDAAGIVDQTARPIPEMRPEEGTVARGVVDDIAQAEEAIAETPSAVGNVSDAPNIARDGIDAKSPLRVTEVRGDLRDQVSSQLLDEDSPVIRAFREADKADGGNRVEQWMFDSDNVRTSNAAANNYLENSPELRRAFRGVESFDDLDRYAAARSELSMAEQGKRTSKSLQELQDTVNALDAQYGARFAEMNAYYKNLAIQMHQAGIIDDATVTKWLQNDDYVRIQRDMDDLFQFTSNRSGSKSFGRTSATQKRVGSEREVLSPTKTVVARTQEVFKEINRNKLANEAIDAFEQLGLAERTAKAQNKNTISRYVNGVKEIWEVPVEIKEVFSNVNPVSFGAVQKALSLPSRVLRAGTTALSAPFTVTNYLRDQVSSFIVSDKVAATHNPGNIIRGLSEAIKDQFGGKNSELWEKFEAFAGDQTIYDELRNARNTDSMLASLRGGPGAIKGKALTPIRTLEDLNSITEKATRFQNFKGVYEDMIKKGASEEDAIRRAVVKARENSVNFNRATNFTRGANMLFPYFNASIQGVRTVGRSFRDRPLQTSAKSIGVVGLPAAALTLYNYGDEKRRQVIENIPQFEKDNNFILVSPWAEQQEDGSWTGVFKVPKPQGYREITQPLQDVAELYASGESPRNVMEMFQQVASGMTGPVQIGSANQFVGSLIPQGIKPAVQSLANKDFYTGAQIVPDFIMADSEDPTDQAFRGTSGTARFIANALGVSPIKVEKAINDTFGSLGRYGVNAADNLLAATGNIPEEQIGGRSVVDDFSRRLFEAKGTEIVNPTEGQQFFRNLENAVNEVGLNSQQKKQVESVLYPSRTSPQGETLRNKSYYDSAAKATLYLRDPQLFEVSKAVDRMNREQGRPGDPLYDLTPQQQKLILTMQSNPSPGNYEEKAIMELNPWIEGFYQKRSEFFDQVQAGMSDEQKAQMGVDPAGMTIPQAPATLDRYNQIEDSTEKRKFLEANPEVADYFTEQNNYTRVKRAFMGLPQFDKYPAPSDEVQKLMDEYNALPKGDGPLKSDGTPSSPTRSNWIKNNQAKWNKIQEQFAKINIYNLQKAGALGVYEGLGFSNDDFETIGRLNDYIESQGGGGGGYGGYGSGGRKTLKAKYSPNIKSSLGTAPAVPKLKAPAKLKVKVDPKKYQEGFKKQDKVKIKYSDA